MKSPELSNKKKGGLFIASGSTHPELARKTAEFMGLELGCTENKMFANTELYARYADSVRGKHVIIMQTHAAVDGRSTNDALQEQLIMIDAAERASAKRITAVSPYLAYQRQDRKARGRESIAGALAIKQLALAGVDRIVSVDLHSPQMQSVFDGPFDHVVAQPLFLDVMRPRIQGHESEFVLVSPDGGRAKVTQEYGEELDVKIVHMNKFRSKDDPSKIKRANIVENVGGRTCVIIDDMIDTAGTLVTAAEILRKSGAERIIAAATHSIFSEPAYGRILDSSLDEVVVTDTIPQFKAKEALGDRLTVVPIAPLIGQVLIEVITEGSVSRMFNDQNHG